MPGDEWGSWDRDDGRRVEVDRTTTVFDDFFRIDESLVRYERFDGHLSDTLRLLTFERGDAVAGVIVHRDSDQVLLVEQFRFATHRKGDGWILELVAGMIEPGEDPETVMRREVREEMGFAVSALEPLGVFYTSPGGSSERIFLYYGEVSDAARVGRGGGLEQEGENVRLVPMHRDEIAGALGYGRILDAKTIIGLMWLQNRGSR